MALPMPIPHWLNVNPNDFVAASQSGTNSGLAAARIWQQAANENAQLQAAAIEHERNAKIKEEAIQQKAIYDAQANLTDQARVKAQISIALAKNQQVQEAASQKAQQWTQDMALKQATEKLNENRLAELTRHNKAIETGKVPPLTRDQSIDAQQLKTQISALDKMIVDPAQARNVDALTKRRDELVSNLKLIGKQFGFSPVMGERQEADEASMRDYMNQDDSTEEKPKKLKYTIVPADDVPQGSLPGDTDEEGR